jgi:hypothetical protein
MLASKSEPKPTWALVNPIRRPTSIRTFRSPVRLIPNFVNSNCGWTSFTGPNCHSMMSSGLIPSSSRAG